MLCAYAPARAPDAPMSIRLALCLVLAALAVPPAVAQGIWTDVVARTVAPTSRALPESYRALALDRDALDARLMAAPVEVTPGSLVGAVQVPLPLPDGTTPLFRVVE